MDEILTMVNIALGNGQILDCEAADSNHNGQVTVDEILAGVYHVLTGCPTPAIPTYSISGTIRYAGSGLPVPGVVVDLTGTTTLSVETGADGHFAFFPVGQGNWQIQPRKTGDLGDSIDIVDAVLVLRSTVGSITLTAQQQLAADVSGDGSVDINDAVVILRYTVGAITHFPTAELCGSEWIFIPAPMAAPSQSVTEPLISGGICQPGSISFDPLSAEATSQDFEAILIGDCALDWSGVGLPAAAVGGLGEN